MKVEKLVEACDFVADAEQSLTASQLIAPAMQCNQILGAFSGPGELLLRYLKTPSQLRGLPNQLLDRADFDAVLTLRQANPFEITSLDHGLDSVFAHVKHLRRPLQRYDQALHVFIA